MKAPARTPSTNIGTTPRAALRTPTSAAFAAISAGMRASRRASVAVGPWCVGRTALAGPGRARTPAAAGPAPAAVESATAQKSPTTFPSASMSIFSPAGWLGSPGIVRMSPASG